MARTRHEMAHSRWAAAVHEAVFGFAPSTVARTSAEPSGAEMQLALVAPDGHVAFASVLFVDGADSESEAALAERVQRTIARCTGRAVRCFGTAGPSAGGGAVQAESAAGAVSLGARDAWLDAMPIAPPCRGSGVDIELALPSEASPACGVLVPSEHTGCTVVLESLRLGAALELGTDSIRVTPSDARSAPQPRVRFAGRVADVVGGVWSLQLEPLGTVVWADGHVARATWVTDGVRMAVRIDEPVRHSGSGDSGATEDATETETIVMPLPGDVRGSVGRVGAETGGSRGC